jgi:LDH2 family malate/lactate/ureidoglycolate dehydrogenase
MKISIGELNDQVRQFLIGLGFEKEEAICMAENILEAELAGKTHHGLGRLPWIKQKVAEGLLKINHQPLTIERETSVSFIMNGQERSGYYVIDQSLKEAFERIKKAKIVSVGLTNTSRSIGYVGLYARKAAEKDLIFICVNNSSGGLIPYGAKKDLWGTNPLTISIPTNGLPIILDMASSKITWGELLSANSERSSLPENIALDAMGNPTTDPSQALEGGLLPIAGPKGSGLAFVIEILAGALTASRVGYSVEGGWGSFYVLIDPTLFRDLKEFKDDIDKAIVELKSAPKQEGFKELCYPGEHSLRLRQMNLKKGEVDLPEDIAQLLKSF